MFQNDLTGENALVNFARVLHEFVYMVQTDDKNA